jgi:hypothetical protein
VQLVFRGLKAHVEHATNCYALIAPWSEDVPGHNKALQLPVADADEILGFVLVWCNVFFVDLKADWAMVFLGTVRASNTRQCPATGIALPSERSSTVASCAEDPLSKKHFHRK